MQNDFYTSTQSYRVQKTLKHPVSFDGVGLHTGTRVRMVIQPAPENHGIVFIRSDLKKAPRIFAHFESIVATSLATSLGFRDQPDARVSTVEHVMAALFAMGITNVLVQVNGPEVPILDGSAAPFIEAILDAGIEFQPVSTSAIKVIKPIKIYEHGAICELLPRESLRLTTSIDFPHPAIGLQTFALELTPQSFEEEVARARTFGFMRDLEKLRSNQLALGATLENVLAFSEDGVVNEGGMRFADECVRHKLLDAVGDLALCGAWIQGEMVSFRGGHSIHLSLLKALQNHRSHWELIPAEPINSIGFVQPATAAVPLPRALQN